MLSTRQLELAAMALDHLGSPIETNRAAAQEASIAAEDARRMAQAANGMPNLPTMFLRMAIDNDRTMVDALTERARTIYDRSEGLREALDWHDGEGDTETAEHGEQATRLTVSYLADDLRDFLRDDIGETVAAAATFGRYGEGRQVYLAGRDAIMAMAHYALSEVDWLSVAREYLNRSRATAGELSGASA